MTHHTLLILVMNSFLFLGCSRYQTLQDTTVKVSDIQPIVISTPTLADLEVNPQRVEITLSAQEWNKYVGVIADRLKKEALSKLRRQSKADVLVEIQSYVEVGKQNKVTVTVSAYPARYRNFRSISISDLKKLQKIKANQTHSTRIQADSNSTDHTPKVLKIKSTSSDKAKTQDKKAKPTGADKAF